MSKLLIILFLVLGLYANDVDKYYKQLQHLSIEQKEVMLMSYMHGIKYDLGYTLAAIAWNESNFGKFKMNTKDGDNLKYTGSYGVYHLLLNSIMGNENNKSYWHASRIAEKLYSDDNYCASKAIEQLLYWKRYWKHKNVNMVYSHMVGSYNTGYNSIKYSSGKKYAKTVLSRVKAIKRYFKVNNIIKILE